ncbi:MAG TPA: adenylosuccinate lyase family protein [Solirubrobacterales bacterium]|nr:adenylosuccinate lyase family protein [Solirubrobacterales bacterium]
MPDSAHPISETARGHISDSRFHGHMYATEFSRKVFGDTSRLQRWLDVEAALAASQADVGTLPREIADAIGQAASLERLDLERVAAEIRHTGHSLMALIVALQHACEDDAGQFVHYGATTQDIQDTAQALEMRDCLDEAERLLLSISRRLVPLGREHIATVMTGRTHAQPALPITFGLKVGSWLDELQRAHQRMRQVRSTALVVQLFGGVGSMAAFGESADSLVNRFAERLGLGAPKMAWHASRDRVMDYVTTMAMLAATCARIADEIRTLSRPELGELVIGWHFGKIGSSTMPHKRNPEECEQIVVLARLAAAQVPVALQGMVVEHERDSRELRTEWSSVADVSHYSLTALSILDDVLADLDVDSDAMASNAADTAADLATEQLMLLLVRHLGKQSAYEVVYEAAQAAKSNGRSLREELLLSERNRLSAEEIDAALDPAGYIGRAPEIAGEMIGQADAWLEALAAEEAR